MKKERIEDLWNNHRTTALVEEFDGIWELMFFEHFKNAIIEAEYEWYKKLEKKLQLIMESTPFNPIVNINPLTDYFDEIQNKIKELENEN